MSKLSVVQGATSVSVNLFCRDSSSGIGAGLAGIAPAGGSLLTGTKLDYSFSGANAARVNVSLSVLATVGSAYSSGGIVQIDNTNMIGWVRVDIPNAALVGSSGRVVSFLLWGGTNMAPTAFEISLDAVNNQSATAFITGVNSLAPPTNWNAMAITAAGGVAPDWANVKSPTTTVGLTGTTISSSQIVASVTAGVTLAASAVTAIWAALTSALTTVGSIGKLIVDNLDAAISSRTKPADTQVTDMTQTAVSEPGQTAPAVSATPATKISWLYKAWRNRTTQTATQYSLYADNTTTLDNKASFSDDTVTADRSEVGSGP